MAKKKLESKLQGNIFLLFGLLFIGIFIVWRYHSLRILSFSTSDVSVPVVSNGIKPIHIKSYPVGIDISVKDAQIIDGVWQIHPNDANYLVSSAGIGDNGNVIVYGHNKNDILGPLRWIKEGAIVEVLASDGLSYEYEVVSLKEVEPDNLEYIKPSDYEVLTIYTCTGFLDTKRFIVQAILKK